MLPGMNSRQMKQMMKQMGIQQQDIPADRVEIYQGNTKLVIDNPQVAKVNMMGQNTWQVIGEARQETLDTKAEINQEDIQTVMEQTGASEEDAKKAIEEADGDLAEAIMKLS